MVSGNEGKTQVQCYTLVDVSKTYCMSENWTCLDQDLWADFDEYLSN